MYPLRGNNENNRNCNNYEEERWGVISKIVFHFDNAKSICFRDKSKP